MTAVPKKCAVYTRKSSEEGLEQDFNSLDAQREACLAYITSQRAEGWSAVGELYDDGGYSGGNMERPGLARLLEDIRGGRVDIVVVYKIDRLTRSLMDFARLVEVFDRHDVTFVSVTQSFNTTTSMGRLTLNVLLSFAQFEREVTGERIRDKIAASKKKGMWMGGARPTGYDIKDKKLIVNKEEAELIRLIFRKYTELGCVRGLKGYLDQKGIQTKHWISRRGRAHGRASFSKGILYQILKNPVYIGRIRHRDKVYEGQHEAIIPESQWLHVQEKLSNYSRSRRGQKKPAVIGNLLKGKLFDCEGHAYSPIFTSRGVKRYRYYVSQEVLHDRVPPKGVVGRIPAQDIEDIVVQAARRHMQEQGMADDQPIAELLRVTVHAKTLKISFEDGEVEVPFEPVQSGRSFVVPGHVLERDPLDMPQPQLKALVKGTLWRGEHFAGLSMREIALREGIDERHVRRLITSSLEII